MKKVYFQTCGRKKRCECLTRSFNTRKLRANPREPREIGSPETTNKHREESLLFVTDSTDSKFNT